MATTTEAPPRQTLFLRNATGLVKAWSTFDALPLPFGWTPTSATSPVSTDHCLPASRPSMRCGQKRIRWSVRKSFPPTAREPCIRFANRE